MYCKICSIIGAVGICCCYLDMSCDTGAIVGDGGGESSFSVFSYKEQSSLSEEMVAKLD